MIGERLAEVRKDNNDTQKDLAKKVNVVVHTVSSWEQGKSEPSHELLVRICQLYGISSDYLLGLTNIDPGYLQKKSKNLSLEDQAIIKDVEEFLAWRNQKRRRETK